MFDSISTGRYWDKPWSLVSGCTRCSPGCKHCWALAMERRFGREVGTCEGGIYHPIIKIHPELLDIPLKRKKPTVWAIWNDLFWMDLKTIPDSFIDATWKRMAQCPQHIFLILTKRPRRMLEFVRDIAIPNYEILKNVWLGCTVVNQPEADEKIPILLQIPAMVRWISIEPMLGPIDFRAVRYMRGNALFVGDEGGSEYSGSKRAMVNLVVLGGETGPGARPIKTEWVRDVRDQCTAAGVKFFFKAWGPRKEVGRILDGRTWNELPKVK